MEYKIAIIREYIYQKKGVYVDILPPDNHFRYKIMEYMYHIAKSSLDKN